MLPYSLSQPTYPCRARLNWAEHSRTSLSHVFWALAVILLAFAGFTVIVVRLRRPVRASDSSTDVNRASTKARSIDLEQLKGFVYVGAAALALLAVAVILMGLYANVVVAPRAWPCSASSATRHISSRRVWCSTS